MTYTKKQAMKIAPLFLKEIYKGNTNVLGSVINAQYDNDNKAMKHFVDCVIKDLQEVSKALED